MASAELFKKGSPTHPVKQTVHTKVVLLQALKVCPLPKDKLVFRENLSGIFNIVDGEDARGPVLLRGALFTKRF